MAAAVSPDPGSQLLSALEATLPPDALAEILKRVEAELERLLPTPEFAHFNLWGQLIGSVIAGEPGAIGLFHTFLMLPRPRSRRRRRIGR